MSISGMIALIAGAVTAACAIAGAIAGIRARRAQEARNAEMRRIQEDMAMDEIRRRRNRFLYPQPVQYVQSPQSGGEIHHYYHNIGNPYQFQPQPNYQQTVPVGTYSSNEPTWRGEQEIGLMSRMRMMQNRFFPQQFQPNYYPQANYAYAL